jgi:hypothetical protein
VRDEHRDVDGQQQDECCESSPTGNPDRHGRDGGEDAGKQPASEKDDDRLEAPQSDFGITEPQGALLHDDGKADGEDEEHEAHRPWQSTSRGRDL